MPNKYEQILSDISTRSNLLKIVQEGNSPDEIKQNMIAAFHPFFDNKQNLEDLVLLTLVGEFHSLLILSKTQYFDYFWDCLNTYKRAKLIDPELSFEGIAIFEEQMTEAVGRFWSIYFLQEDLRELDDEELLFECISKMGEITEGLTKPFLKTLLYQVKITIGEKRDHKKIESLSLGQLTNELIQKSGYPDLFIPKPKNLKLNEWRNISYHHSASVIDSIITCGYGENNNKIVKLTKTELIQTCQNLFWIVDTIKLAHKIFSVDNIYEIEKFEKQWKNGHVRKETEFQQLALGLMTQGFEIKKFNFDNHDTNVKIFDVTNVKNDALITRVAHVSQFIFYFWSITGSEEINIEFENGSKKFLISANGSNCQNFERKNISLSEFINRTEITNLLTGEKI